MTMNKVQDCIDSAGRLAAYLSELYADIEHADVLMICAQANVGLTHDTRLAETAYQQLMG